MAFDGDIVLDDQLVREHDGIANIIAHGNIFADFAIVRVHIVHGIAQIAEAIPTEDIAFACVDENAVAAFRNIVADHTASWRIP